MGRNSIGPSFYAKMLKWRGYTDLVDENKRLKAENNQLKRELIELGKASMEAITHVAQLNSFERVLEARAMVFKALDESK